MYIETADLIIVFFKDFMTGVQDVSQHAMFRMECRKPHHWKLKSLRAFISTLVFYLKKARHVSQDCLHFV